MAHHEHTSHEDEFEHHVIPLSVYYKVFAVLMIGLVLTVGVALFDFAHILGSQWAWLNIVLAMIIAVGKALVVVLYFMHVKYSSRLTQLFASAGLLWLSILFIFTFADYFTRSWQHVPEAWDVPGQAAVVHNPTIDHGRSRPLPDAVHAPTTTTMSGEAAPVENAPVAEH